MIKEFYKINGDEVSRYSYVEGTRHIYNCPSKGDLEAPPAWLNTQLNFSPNFHRTEAGAYQQIIRNLQKEIEEIKFELAATRENSKRHLDSWNKTVDEKKALEKKIQDYSELLKVMEAQAAILSNEYIMEMRRRQAADVKIEEMKLDRESKRKLQMEMVRLCRKRRFKIEGMEKEISGLKDTVQLWRSNADEWKELSGKWEQDCLNLKEKLQREIESLKHDRTALTEKTAEHIIEIVDLKKENKDKDAYYAGLLKNKDAEIIDLKIRLSIANAVQEFTDCLYRLASKKTTKTENV